MAAAFGSPKTRRNTPRSWSGSKAPGSKRSSDPTLGFGGLPSHHQVHRRLGGDVLLHSVAERGKIDAFEQRLALAEQDWRDGEVHLVQEPRLQILADGG